MIAESVAAAGSAAIGPFSPGKKKGWSTKPRGGGLLGRVRGLLVEAVVPEQVRFAVVTGKYLKGLMKEGRTGFLARSIEAQTNRSLEALDDFSCPRHASQLSTKGFWPSTAN